MAFNYGYPVTYNPNNAYGANPTMQTSQSYGYGQPMQQSYTQPPTQGIVWVQGEAAAKAYPVPAGSNAVLMDSEGDVFYIKATDATGMPLPLRVFEYKEVVRTEPQASNAAPQFDPNEYVRKEELDDLRRQIQNMNNNSRKDRNNNAKSSV